MKKLKLVFAIILTAIAVALTYHVFENAVHASIRIIWTEWLPTNQTRWLVVPLCLVLSGIYFGAQHYLDKKAEKKTAEGLGEAPDPTITNYLKILLIGYFSLIAGASLGPEAVLVPACLCVGALLGKQILGNKKEFINLAAMAGFIALFTAFFHSAIIGVLSLFLLLKQSKAKFQPILLVMSVLSATVAWFTLNAVEGKAYVSLPAYSWKLTFTDVVLSVVLVAVGYGCVLLMGIVHEQFLKLKERKISAPWWGQSLLAASVLSVLYLMGGPLVEFTGNESIQPLFHQASSLGLIGLLWILIIKIAAISWSKAAGYRGGMIFPTIFVASVLIAIVQIYAPSYNLIYGFIAVLIGAFIANSKNSILV